jgi:hypothetical protein
MKQFLSSWRVILLRNVITTILWIAVAAATVNAAAKQSCSGALAIEKPSSRNGSCSYSVNPIKIISRNTNFVTVSVKQVFLRSKLHRLTARYVEFADSSVACDSAVDVASGSSFQVTMTCDPDVKQVDLELFIQDDALDSAGVDTASLLDPCNAILQDPKVCSFVFQVPCSPDCGPVDPVVASFYSNSDVLPSTTADTP